MLIPHLPIKGDYSYFILNIHVLFYFLIEDIHFLILFSHFVVNTAEEENGNLYKIAVAFFLFFWWGGMNKSYEILFQIRPSLEK